MPYRIAFWSLGVGGLAAAAVAASHGGPVEAVVPPEKAIPAAERVETVLRATYVLPSGRGRMLAEFLSANAVAGLETRLDSDGTLDRLTVVAPEDAQRALGGFIGKCVSAEPSSNDAGFGSPTLAPPLDGDGPPSGTFESDRPTPAAPPVPDYADPRPGDSPGNDGRREQPIRMRPTPDDGVPSPSGGLAPQSATEGESPLFEREPAA